MPSPLNSSLGETNLLLGLSEVPEKKTAEMVLDDTVRLESTMPVGSDYRSKE